MEGNCSPDTAVEVEQAVAEADQKRQVLVPGKLVAGHILGIAEVVGVQSADYSLNTEYRTAAAPGGAPVAAECHSRAAASTAGTSDLGMRQAEAGLTQQKRNIFKAPLILSPFT